MVEKSELVTIINELKTTETQIDELGVEFDLMRQKNKQMRLPLFPEEMEADYKSYMSADLKNFKRKKNKTCLCIIN